MFGTNVFVLQSTRFIDGELDNLFRTFRQPYLAHNWPVAAAYDELDCGSRLV